MIAKEGVRSVFVCFSSRAWGCVLALLGALLGSCGEDEEAPSAPRELVIGTGEWQFEPLVEGQRAQLVAGTQGGYHVWISLRARGFEGERLRMVLELQSSGPAPLARSDLDVRFDPAPTADAGSAGEWVQHLGWPAQLLEPWCAIEQPLSVRATVTDARGRSASAAIGIVPTAPVRGFTQTCGAP